MSERQKTLITGASGFLGSHNSDLLKRAGHHVLKTTSREALANENNNFVFLDPKNEKHFTEVVLKNKPDHVIHMAAYSAPADSERDDARLINVSSVENAVKAIISAKIKDSNYDPIFVFYSSIEVYGDNLSIINEKTEPNPQSKYAKMKLEAEKYVTEACRTNNIRYIIVQQGQTIGVGQSERFLIPKVVSQLADIVTDNNIQFDVNGNPCIETGYVGHKRTLLDARDSANAIKQLLESGKYGRYIVCGDNTQTLDMVIKELISLAQKEAEYKVITHTVSHGIATPQPDKTFSNQKIKNTVGWYPKRSLHETLKWIMYEELAKRAKKVS